MQLFPNALVFTLLFVEDIKDPKIILIQREGKLGWAIPSSKITDCDSNSTVNTSARTTIKKIGNIDIRELSIGGQYDLSSIVNWQAYESYKEKYNSEPQEEIIELFRNPFSYMWQKHFTNCPIWNDDVEQKFIYFVSIKDYDLDIIQKYAQKGTQITLQPLSNFKTLNLSKKTEQFYDQLSSLFQNEQYKRIEKSFIYIGFKVPGTERYTPPVPFLHTFALFDGLYRRRYEKWTLYNNPDGEFPTEEELSKATAIVLAGSSISSYDELLWIRKLEQQLHEIYHKHKHLKFLTVCFGMQVMIQAFGGKVEPFPQRILDRKYVCYGNEYLAMNVEEMRKIKCFDNINIHEKHIINKAHQDEITVVPELFINIGSSSKCHNEILMSTDHRILGYQSHAEFANNYQKALFGQYKSLMENKTLQDVLADEDFQKRWGLGVEDKVHREICHAFLKN